MSPSGDNFQEEFKEKVQEVSRKYPKATLAALNNFISLIQDTNPHKQNTMNKKASSVSLDYEVFQGGYVFPSGADPKSPQMFDTPRKSKESLY
eukprot:CAMPEP_0170568250 /NCGR_PEP_ID=MMETSP0211-20121228/81043_1 /TAXON_ID=311385 /ORGANISM="Pseudokeronopsis sp., Strain OXSARD2" /LENGTH=92 /DNA_ID=CAMNT_0010890023 /DNA_START=278 /DNA_END=555 /DNA_ORIENTATION=+